MNPLSHRGIVSASAILLCTNTAPLAAPDGRIEIQHNLDGPYDAAYGGGGADYARADAGADERADDPVARVESAHRDESAVVRDRQRSARNNHHQRAANDVRADVPNDDVVADPFVALPTAEMVAEYVGGAGGGISGGLVPNGDSFDGEIMVDVLPEEEEEMVVQASNPSSQDPYDLMQAEMLQLDATYHAQCPPPAHVGCTAVDIADARDECTSSLGSACDRRNGLPGERCCLDACSRRYCTAKGSYVEQQGGGVANGDDALFIVPVDMMMMDETPVVVVEMDPSKEEEEEVPEKVVIPMDGQVVLDVVEEISPQADAVAVLEEENPADAMIQEEEEEDPADAMMIPVPTIEALEAQNEKDPGSAELEVVLVSDDDDGDGINIEQMAFEARQDIRPVDADGSSNRLEATGDEATTVTGRAIEVDVLRNDHLRRDDDGSEDTGIETSLLVVTDIVSDGINGRCTIIFDNGNGKGGGSKVLYAPDAGYSGPDKCGYRVCSFEGSIRGVCNFATLSITVAKQSEEVQIVAGPRPDDDGATWSTDGATSPPNWVDDHSDIVEPIYLDPEALFTDEVWDEVDEGRYGTDSTLSQDAYDENWGYWNDEIDLGPSSCDSGEVLLAIELQTDEHGGDVTWELVSEDGVAEIERGPYGTYSFDQVDLCVPNPSRWTFEIRDAFGDGLTDDSGRGYYKISLNEREVVHVTHYALGNVHDLAVGYDPSPGMSRRDVEYLHAHNRRRKVWHEAYGVSYVPLVWSGGLAEESERWAAELLGACESDGIEHEKNVGEGENLAKNKGMVDEDGLGWGQLYPPEKIVRRWVDREIGWAYPDNAHLTQSLWRSAKYMGCGEAEKVYGGGMCRVQVCRYAKAGNCGMSAYNSTVGENWLVPMLKDTSSCEPSCPPEGCY
eukprot:CAMPEP_0181083178 /NCGR_PEP_ID=MMETSP1071-20121207/4023_1 /TAXON_ID=35127 /ORGANISM="Thalassiosira sp., Strain NH16" /LENGTH=901 /DNA_ID=CAMNT_0023164827 /DNA_START=194 /DNA_END=2902 /DNA_ORIENTATION=+